MSLNLKNKNILFFIISPFLSIPFIIEGIVRKRDYNLYLLATLIGVVSYLFVPLETNDKAVYYSYYDNFKTIDFSSFIDFLTFNPDFIFYGLIYLFAKLNIKIELLFLVLTSFTTSIYLWFFIKFKFKQVVSGQIYLMFVLGVLFSLSLDTLLSGIRFNLAIALIIISFQKLFFEKKVFIGYLFLLLSVFTHFSFAVFIPFVLLLNLFKNKTLLFKMMFLGSFIFLLIPKNVLISSIPFLDTLEVLENKGNVYLNGEEDFLSNNLKNGNTNNFVVFFISTLWVYLSYFYLFFTFRQKNIIRNIIFIIFSISNFFYQFPTIYTRYLLVLKIFILINIYLDFTNKKISFNVFSGLILIFSVPFFVQLYILSPQLYAGLIDLSSSTMISILFKKSLNLIDFL